MPARPANWKSIAKSVPGVMALRLHQRRLSLALELTRPRRYLFVASHMRSYSTLLGHLLCSSGEVSGYAEMRRSYRAEADLIALAMQVRASHAGKLHGGIVLDKLLHGGHHIGDEILSMDNVDVLISVRHPRATVRSIVALGRTIGPDNWMAQPDRAGLHFVNRMRQLSELTDRIERPLVLAADSLIGHTDSTLRGLERELGLEKQLSAEYEVHEYTGWAEYGDTSKYIGTGRVQAQRHAYGDITISPEIEAETLGAWKQFWEHLDGDRVHIVGHRPQA